MKLIRDFVLDEDSSRLQVTQTIRNVSNETIEYCHWSRTFGVGGGIVVLPVTEPSRFPNKYVMYQPDGAIQMRPVDPHIKLEDGAIVHRRPPAVSEAWFRLGGRLVRLCDAERPVVG